MINFINIFRKNKPQPSRKRWSRHLEYIEQRWESVGAKIVTYRLKTFEEGIRLIPIKVPKNEIHIGVCYFEAENTDIVILTKNEIHFHYPLQKFFEELTKNEMENMGLLPMNTNCQSCGSFSTWINQVGDCMGCQKEKDNITKVAKIVR